MGRVVFLLALFLSLPGCIDQAGVDFAFCEPNEDCWGAPPPITCGSVVCKGLCATAYECGSGIDGGEVCVASSLLPGQDDGNACTHDVCEGDEWKHFDLDPSELDDFDPCTVDQCNPGIGPVHTNTCS